MSVRGYTDETRKRSVALFEQWRSEGVEATISAAEAVALGNRFGVDLSRSLILQSGTAPLGLVAKYVAGREAPLEEGSVWCPECAREVPLTVVRNAHAEGEFHECECGWFSA